MRDPRDRFGSAEWGHLYTLTTAVQAAAALPLGQGMAGTLLLNAACLAQGTKWRDDPKVRSGLIGCSFNYAGFFVGGRLLSRRLREFAARNDEARSLSVRDTHRAATERERNRQHHLVQRDVLVAAEDILREWDVDEREVRRRARRESRRLRSLLADDVTRGSGLRLALEELADGLLSHGLSVEVVAAEIEQDPPPDQVDMVVRAIGELVRQQGAGRVLLRAVSNAEETWVSVRTRGPADAQLQGHWRPLPVTACLLEALGGCWTSEIGPDGIGRGLLWLRGQPPASVGSVPTGLPQNGTPRALDMRAPATGAPEAGSLRRVEGNIAGMVLVTRGLVIGQGVLTNITGRYRLRSRSAALTSLTCASAEVVWLWRRIARGATLDQRPAPLLETLVGVGALLLGLISTDAEDRTTMLHWGWPLSLSSAVYAGAGIRRRRDGALAVALLVVTFVVTLLRGGGRADDEVRGLIAREVPAYALLWNAANVFSTLLRRSAHELDVAHEESIRRAGEIAIEQERGRQHRLLHDRFLQVLEAVAADRIDDRPLLRNWLSQEVDRTRAMLTETKASRPASLLEVLDEVAEDLSARGVAVEVLASHDIVEPSSQVRQAIGEAVFEALTNVTRHAGVDSAAILVRRVPSGIEVEVADEGCGFDPGEPAKGTGMGLSRSIRRRMCDAGGSAEIRSQAGRGTRVILRGPA